MTLANGDLLPPEVELAAIGIAAPLARGGAGTVAAVRPGFLPGAPPLVVKRYHDSTLVDGSALERLVAWRRELTAADRGRLDRLAAWPLAMVVDQGEPAGFLMERVRAEFMENVLLPSGRRVAVVRETQYLLGTPDRLGRLRIADPPIVGRLEIIWRLAEAISFLHARRIVLGDLSARNVLWRADPAQILLVDCDSMTLGGVGSPLAATSTVDWDDPSQPDFPAASADIYKLGLFALRTLKRSFQTREAAAAGELLDATGGLLLRASLHHDPAARPPAVAWERWAAGRRATERQRPERRAAGAASATDD